MKLIRSHLSMMYDDLWSEHIRISTGRIIKPFKDRHKFGTHKLSEGFMSVKPEEFNIIDKNFLTEHTKHYLYNYKNMIIKHADNRMMMGDYRYGSILRQNLNNYDIHKEFFRRIRIAKETENIEYIVDAYNMLRIQYYKTKNYHEFIDLYKYHLSIFIVISYENNWQLTSIDDGVHAQEK